MAVPDTADRHAAVCPFFAMHRAKLFVVRLSGLAVWLRARRTSSQINCGKTAARKLPITRMGLNVALLALFSHGQFLYL